MMRVRLLSISLALWSLAACGSSGGGRVEGDVYLVTRGGDTKRVPGETVWLIADSDSLRREIRAACGSIKTDPVSIGTARGRISSAIIVAIVDTATTDVNGHYRFAAIRPGRYALHASWLLNADRYTWWRRFEAKDGTPLRIDLGSPDEGNEQVHCVDGGSRNP